MQSVSSRIWTRIAVSISFDDNQYTTGTSFLRYEHLFFLFQVHKSYEELFFKVESYALRWPSSHSHLFSGSSSPCRLMLAGISRALFNPSPNLSICDSLSYLPSIPLSFFLGIHLSFSLYLSFSIRTFFDMVKRSLNAFLFEILRNSSLEIQIPYKYKHSCLQCNLLTVSMTFLPTASFNQARLHYIITSRKKMNPRCVTWTSISIT